MANIVEHLYVHVPFCAVKCHYCAFYSEAGSAAQMSAYVEALLAECDHRLAWLSARGYRLEPRTVFFGGGTPSLLPAHLWDRLLTGLRHRVALHEVVEWTIECNPATLTTEKLRLWRDAGVTRLSLGVQALSDDALEQLGRIHTVAQARASYDKARAAGFENVNLDLMFGLPGQTLDGWMQTLTEAIHWQPDHVSAYALTLEEDTEFWRRYAAPDAAPCDLPDAAQQAEMYKRAIELLTAAGFEHYEISNFARAGRACRHNLAYWEGRDYLGLGPSACSTIGDRRWQIAPDLNAYLAHKGKPPVAMEETLTPALRAAERLAFGMRLTAGVPAAWLRGRWEQTAQRLVADGLARWEGDRLRPTERGILFADLVGAEFVS
ncbi:MAG: radical SAM family heme chaperone HemW [Verrucomicrobiae bacterium]|nr:radical SAM family heme chaperone HemW [Verrucomicrobiae bacterium]